MKYRFGYVYTPALDDMIADLEPIEEKIEACIDGAKLAIYRLDLDGLPVLLGEYKDNALIVIDWLEEDDTIQSWCKEWCDSNDLEDVPSFVIECAAGT
jgi:hypothetical protein